jgi:hypothetical protein
MTVITSISECDGNASTKVVGDDVVTTQAINEGLRTWKEQRLRDGKVQDQTINKELRQIVAILNHAKRELALDLNWVTPKIEIRTQERERPVISQEHYRQIFDDITDTKQRRYAVEGICTNNTLSVFSHHVGTNATGTKGHPFRC